MLSLFHTQSVTDAFFLFAFVFPRIFCCIEASKPFSVQHLRFEGNSSIAQWIFIWRHMYLNEKQCIKMNYTWTFILMKMIRCHVPMISRPRFLSTLLCSLLRIAEQKPCLFHEDVQRSSWNNCNIIPTAVMSPLIQATYTDHQGSLWSNGVYRGLSWHGFPPSRWSSWPFMNSAVSHRYSACWHVVKERFAHCRLKTGTAAYSWNFTTGLCRLCL